MVAKTSVSIGLLASIHACLCLERDIGQSLRAVAGQKSVKIFPQLLFLFFTYLAVPTDKTIQEVDVTILFTDGQCEFITIYQDAVAMTDNDLTPILPSRKVQGLIAYIRQHFLTARPTV